MPQQIQLQAEKRTEPAQAVRQKDAVPAVVYGHGADNTSVQVDRKSFEKVFSKAGYTSLINLAVGDAKGADNHTVLIREVQYDPVKSTILHIDLYQPRLDQKIRTNVPLNFVGESPAVKDMGGVLVRAMDEVELEALPTDIPHDIEVDISQLKDFERVIHAKELALPDNVELHHEADEVIALVQPPRSEEELEALEEEVSEDVEGVEGVEETEEGEEAAEGEESTGGEDSQAAAEEHTDNQETKE